jgi:hypothetical protein
LIKKAICYISPEPKENIAPQRPRLEPQPPDISYFS